MACAALLKQIDELNEKYITVWQELCELESPTADKARVDAVSEYIALWANELGFVVETRPMEGAGDPLCITMNPAAAGAPVVFSGHIDTVHPVGLFGYPAARIEEDKLIAPGAVDCKGGVVASMLAMEALLACGFTARPVKLIVQTDEETSSKNSNKQTIAFMLEKAAGAAVFLNTEGCVDNKVTLSRKGIVRFRFTVHGKAAHSARCQKGISAIAEAAHKILRLEEYKDAQGITCNCGIIEGGTVANTVPAECSFVADFRFATEEQYQTILSAVEELCSHSTLAGTTCDVTKVSERPAMELTDANLALFARLNEIFEENGLQTVEKQHAMGGSDAAYTTAAGIPTIDSIGVDGNHIHSANEYGLLSSLAVSAKWQASVAWEL